MSDTLSGSIPQLATGAPVLPAPVSTPAVSPARTARNRGAGARLPSLDGWRAVSILMVLGAHCERVYWPQGVVPPNVNVFRWFDGGMGVLFFFVISGFLITWLLLEENERNGQISLKHFYFRRATRILPVFYAFLLTVAVLQCVTPFRQSLAQWIGNLTFTTNFVPGSEATGHLWSLSVEEQFYLLWPITLLFLIRQTGPRQMMAFLALPLLAAPVFCAMGHHHFPKVLAPLLTEYSFFNNFNLLAVGCACAIYLRSFHSSLAGAYHSVTRNTILIAGLLLVLIPYVFEKFEYSNLVLRTLKVTLPQTSEALGFGLLMVQSVCLPNWGFYRVLSWPIFRRIGVLSYSIYIWQQIFCSRAESFGLHPVWWMAFPGWLVPVLIVSASSYYGLERPILKWRGRILKQAITR